MKIVMFIVLLCASLSTGADNAVTPSQTLPAPVKKKVVAPKQPPASEGPTNFQLQALENAVTNENKKFEALSEASKSNHPTTKNSISNQK